MTTYRYAALSVMMVLAVLVVFCGCQKGTSYNPAAPSVSDNNPLSLTGGIGGDGGRSQAMAPRTNYHAIWGLYHIIIDPDTLEAEVVPLRGSQWHANVVEFMQPPHPPGNLRIFVDETAGDIPNGLFAADITLVHPFPGLPQFRGFDVRGAFLADGNYISANDSSARFADPNPLANEARLINADGYLRWFNPVEFRFGGISILEYINTRLGTDDNTSATLNPYKYFSDDFLAGGTKELSLQEVEIEEIRRGTFSPTSSITRRYMIQFPMEAGIPIFEFSYVIDASYHEPDTGDPSYPIEAFSTSANMQEIYKIVCVDAGSSAYYEDGDTNGGNLRFDLTLYDWQAPFNPSGVLGEIDSILVESPTLLDTYGGTLDLTNEFALNAAFNSETSSVASIEILDVTPQDFENQVLFFTVRCSNPTDYGNPWGNPYPPDPLLASYFMWEAPISNEYFNTPPTVGQVVGPTPVDSNMGALNYSAPVTDPDTGQTLTASWSVVPTGDPPDYTIAGNLDLSVDIDWSDYLPDADYDVNLRVYDGYDYGYGTLMTVTHNNTAPTVGQVIGTTPVQVDDTENYSAPVTDPDTQQTLTAMWSVVPLGNPANYNISANGTGYSLDQDWGSYDVDFYEVNLEIDDGVAPPAYGTPMTVELENTPPQLGTISGDTSVDESDTSSQYDPGTLTDPDNNQTYTYMWSLVPDGQAADFSIIPTGPGNSLVVNWCNYLAGEYDMQVQVYDGYDYGQSPILNIVRGLSVCNGTAHSYSGTGNWARYSFNPYSSLPRLDIDFFRQGNFAGQGVVQAGPNCIMNFVPSGTGNMPNPPIQFKWGMPSNYNIVLSLDASPDLDPGDSFADNRLVTVLSRTPDIITVYDADVFLPSDWPGPLLTQISDVSGADGITCIGIDEQDDIWALVRESGTSLYLDHWTYILDDNTGGPYYTYESSDRLNLTASIGYSTNIFDMVVAYSNNYLYVLDEGAISPHEGRIHMINLNTSPPTYVDNEEPIFTDEMRFDFVAVLGQATGADISIDHIGYDNCQPEHCRLIAISWLDIADARPTEVVRLDLDLNIQDSEQTSSELYWPSGGLATNTQVSQRYIYCPGTGNFGIWSPAADW